MWIWVFLKKSLYVHLVKSVSPPAVQIQSNNQNMKLIGIKEVSEILNVKPSTLYQWCELGQIPCYKINGALRFDIEDIIKWVKSCKRDAHSSYNPFAQTARSPGKEGKQ
jgi:excisionase family DNA binding protein